MSKLPFDQLLERLEAEGYGHLLAEKGTKNVSIYDLRLEHSGHREQPWRVCDTERGHVLKTYLSTDDEAEACALWYAKVSNMYLLLRTWPSVTQAERAAAELTKAGIRTSRNDLPDDPYFKGMRYRNFVAGRDLHRGAEILAAID